VNNIYIKQGKICMDIAPGHCCLQGTQTAAILDGVKGAKRASTTLKFTDVTLEVFPGPNGTLGHVDIYTENMDHVEIHTTLGESDELPPEH